MLIGVCRSGMDGGMAVTKVLSLDGGGTWALIQVKALMKIYGDVSGHEILKRFQFVAANSGGSIVLAMMVSGVRLSKILDLFTTEESRRTIFVELPWWQRIPRLVGLGPQYSAKAKLAGLQKLLGNVGEMKMSELPEFITKQVGSSPQFLITTFGYDRLRAIYLRSNQESLAGSFGGNLDVTLAEAVHASTNAPINYFDAPAILPSVRCWDGGIGGNNNPVYAALVEVIANKMADPSDIHVLSIGTGLTFLPLSGPATDPALVVAQENPGLGTDIKKIATAVLDDPPDAATFHSHILLNQPLPSKGTTETTGTVVRMNPLLQPVKKGGTWDVPEGINLNEFRRLKELGLDGVEQGDVELIVRFCEEWLVDHVRNQPIRSGPEMQPEIGHGSFSLALEQWRRFDPSPSNPPTDLNAPNGEKVLGIPIEAVFVG